MSECDGVFFGGSAKTLPGIDGLAAYGAVSWPRLRASWQRWKRDGWIETRRSGSYRVLVKGDQQRVWAYHDGVDLGGPAMTRIARDYGYTTAELRKL